MIGQANKPMKLKRINVVKYIDFNKPISSVDNSFESVVYRLLNTRVQNKEEVKLLITNCLENSRN